MGAENNQHHQLIGANAEFSSHVPWAVRRISESAVHNATGQSRSFKYMLRCIAFVALSCSTCFQGSNSLESDAKENLGR